MDDKTKNYLIVGFSAISGYYIVKFLDSIMEYSGKKMTPGLGIIIYGVLLLILFGLLAKLIMD